MNAGRALTEIIILLVAARSTLRLLRLLVELRSESLVLGPDAVLESLIEKFPSEPPTL